MTRHSVALTTLGFGPGSASAWPALAQGKLAELHLEKLPETKVTRTSIDEQKRGDVAASVGVMPREEIKPLGRATPAEALARMREANSHASQEIRALVAKRQS